MFNPSLMARPVCRDKDDDEVLALPLVAQVDIVISGDDDLLNLGSFEAIPLLTPPQAMQKVLVTMYKPGGAIHHVSGRAATERDKLFDASELLAVGEM